MKKIIAIILSVLTLALACIPVAFAADSYTKAYSITTLDEQAGQFTIKNVDGTSNYVNEGGVFKFTIEYEGSYQPNDTTCYRAFRAATYYTDIINMTEDNIADFTFDGTDKLIPDENGVYTLGTEAAGVTEDIVIVAYNLTNKNGSWIINLLTRMGQFFTDLINWFFGLKNVIPGVK
jgi:hypothetical protein